MPVKGDRHVAAQRTEEILAVGADCVLHWCGGAMAQTARRLGISRSGLHPHMQNEEDLIRQLCLRHINEAFDAVCLPTDWRGAPTEVLRAMGLGLLAYADEKPSRHLVFLLHRHTLHDAARNANDTLLTYLTNNFQLALQAVQPERPFDDLQHPARMLLGQIMHLPLWWPAEPDITKDQWLCHQIGLLTGLSPPDWRVPAADRMQDPAFGSDHRGDRYAGDPPSRAIAY